MASSSDFSAFVDENVLTSRLMAAAMEKSLPDVCIGLLANGQQLFAATDESLRTVASTEARDFSIGASCFAKPVTATIVARAVADRQLEWSDSVDRILGLGGIAGIGILDISIRQLLNHSHGLDASTLETIPRTAAGFIDVRRLCTHLRTPPISAPGQLYSYGNSGVWLAAAALEVLTGRRCAHLLRELSAAVPGWDGIACDDNAFCPATGGSFAMTASQWLSFLEMHCRLESLGTLREAPFPLPGWSPIERGAGLGWKHYGEGWFGHHSSSPTRSALLRFHPEQQLAIVLSAPGDTAFAAYAAILGDLVPEVATLTPPRLLKSHERDGLHLESFVGVYTQARSSIEISISPKNILLLSIYGNEHSIPPRTLRPAVSNIFIPTLRDTPEFAFIQFVTSANARREHDYLWNGRQLWKRN